MIKEANYKGAREKIEHDLIDKVDKWIIETQRSSVKMALEFTLVTLEKSEGKYYLAIYYLEEGTELQGFVWDQSIEGVESSTIFLIAGTEETFANNSIFYIPGERPASGIDPSH